MVENLREGQLPDGAVGLATPTAAPPTRQLGQQGGGGEEGGVAERAEACHLGWGEEVHPLRVLVEGA